MLASRTVRRASLSLNHLLLYFPCQYPLAETGVQQGGTSRNGRSKHLVLTKQCLRLQTFSVPIENTCIHMCEHTHICTCIPQHTCTFNFGTCYYYFKVKTNKNGACLRTVIVERTPPDYHFSRVRTKYKGEALTSVRKHTSKD